MYLQEGAVTLVGTGVQIYVQIQAQPQVLELEVQPCCILWLTDLVTGIWVGIWSDAVEQVSQLHLLSGIQEGGVLNSFK